MLEGQRAAPVPNTTRTATTGAVAGVDRRVDAAGCPDQVLPPLLCASLEPHGDVAWSYREPLREATEITGRLAFFNEQVDLVVDGALLARPVTPWSQR
jgi:hypothetical protein